MKERWTATAYFSYGAIQGGAPHPVGKIDVMIVPRELVEGEEPFEIIRYYHDSLEENPNRGMVSYYEIMAMLSPSQLAAAQVRIDTRGSVTGIRPDTQHATAAAKKVVALLLTLRSSFDHEVMILHSREPGELEGGYLHRLTAINGSIPKDVKILYVPPGCPIKLANGARPLRLHVGITWEEFLQEIRTMPASS